MKNILACICLLACMGAFAAEPAASFDFNNPESLNPSVTAPAMKNWVDLDGRSFTDAGVTITFKASTTGNTHVRLYHSYDAGCDVRIYDGESLTVSAPEGFDLDRIDFTMSLSGAATGSADINFDPSAGTFTWEDECWQAGAEAVHTVELISQLQSRLAAMSVQLKATAGLGLHTVDASVPEEYYSLTGNRLTGRPTNAGIYIVRRGNTSSKFIVK